VSTSGLVGPSCRRAAPELIARPSVPFCAAGLSCSRGRRWRAPYALIVPVVGWGDDAATPTGAPRRGGSSFQQGSATVSVAFSSEMDARSELCGLDGTVANDPALHPGSIEIDRDDQDWPLTLAGSRRRSKIAIVARGASPRTIRLVENEEGKFAIVAADKCDCADWSFTRETSSTARENTYRQYDNAPHRA
jgi:hypothetical protein